MKFASIGTKRSGRNAGVFLETCVSGNVTHCLATVWLVYNVAGILAHQFLLLLLLLLFFQSKYYISKVHETISHKNKVSYLKCLPGLCRYDAALIENGIHYAATATAQRSSKMTASLNKYYSFLIHLIYLTLMFFYNEQSWSFRKGELILSQETPKTNADC